MIPTNPLNRIQDIKKRKQVTEICSRIQRLHREWSKDIDEVLREMNLPIAVHLFITGNFSELMALVYPEIPNQK